MLANLSAQMGKSTNVKLCFVYLEVDLQVLGEHFWCLLLHTGVPDTRPDGDTEDSLDFSEQGSQSPGEYVYNDYVSWKQHSHCFPACR